MEPRRRKKRRSGAGTTGGGAGGSNAPVSAGTGAAVDAGAGEADQKNGGKPGKVRKQKRRRGGAEPAVGGSDGVSQGGSGGATSGEPQAKRKKLDPSKKRKKKNKGNKKKADGTSVAPMDAVATPGSAIAATPATKKKKKTKRSGRPRPKKRKNTGGGDGKTTAEKKASDGKAGQGPTAGSTAKKAKTTKKKKNKKKKTKTKNSTGKGQAGEIPLPTAHRDAAASLFSLRPTVAPGTPVPAAADGRAKGGKKRNKKKNKGGKAGLAAAATGEEAEAAAIVAGVDAEAALAKNAARLRGSRFRWLNEQLYTKDSRSTVKLFRTDPELFDVYHAGYREQIAKWPTSPLDLILDWLGTRPVSDVVADMGCGEARLALEAPQTTVHSFDLVAANERVVACDCSNTPLEAGTCDVVIFSLSLMATNTTAFIVEANRILSLGGVLLIAEVESRFEDIERFVADIGKMGFDVMSFDDTHRMFLMFAFTKAGDVDMRNKKKLPKISLKPCLYKRR